MAVDTSQFRNGLKIELDGEPFTMIFFQHVKPGKGGAFVRTKVKNLKTGRVLDRTFRAGERVEEADVEERTMQYLYLDGANLVFMDTQSYDQIPFSPDQVGDARKFLKENTEVDVLFWNGRPVNIDLPSFIELQVARCDPGLKGDTASGATKPATLETGAVVNVPLFVKEGDILRIDTEGRRVTIPVGYGTGRLVAVAAAPDGAVFAAERGGQGRIERIDAAGRRQVVFQRDGAQFYGVAVDGVFLYALDLAERQLLRIPLPEARPNRMAGGAAPGPDR